MDFSPFKRLVGKFTSAVADAITASSYVNLDEGGLKSLDEPSLAKVANEALRMNLDRQSAKIFLTDIVDALNFQESNPEFGPLRGQIVSAVTLMAEKHEMENEAMIVALGDKGGNGNKRGLTRP